MTSLNFFRGTALPVAVWLKAPRKIRDRFCRGATYHKAEHDGTRNDGARNDGADVERR